MTMNSSNVGAVRRHSPGIGQIVHRWIADAAERWRIRREMAELSHLPRHRLQDMGLEDYAQPREPANWHHRR